MSAAGAEVMRSLKARPFCRRSGRRARLYLTLEQLGEFPISLSELATMTGRALCRQGSLMAQATVNRCSASAIMGRKPSPAPSISSCASVS